MLLEHDCTGDCVYPRSQLTSSVACSCSRCKYIYLVARSCTLKSDKNSQLMSLHGCGPCLANLSADVFIRWPKCTVPDWPELNVDL